MVFVTAFFGVTNIYGKLVRKRSRVYAIESRELLVKHFNRN